MSDKRLSFAKRPLLKRSADAVFEAYDFLIEYDVDDIQEFLGGDVAIAAVSCVTGIDEETIITEIIKQSKQHQKVMV
jgi:hypothetical protein